MKRVLLISGALFILLGVFVASAAYRPDGRSSIKDASSIAVLASGQIAVAIAQDEEVQVYSADGEYLSSVPIDSGHGWIRLKSLPTGGFQAATVRNRKVYTVDENGVVVSAEDSPDGFEQFGGGDSWWEARSASGQKYLLDGPLLIQQDGAARRVLVDDRRRWGLGGEPLFAAALLLSGLAQLLVAFFGAERFKAALFAAARMKQPQWVDPQNPDAVGPKRSSSQPPASSRVE